MGVRVAGTVAGERAAASAVEVLFETVATSLQDADPRAGVGAGEEGEVDAEVVVVPR